MATTETRSRGIIGEIANDNVRKLAQKFESAGGRQAMPESLEKAAKSAGYTRKMAYDTLWRHGLVGPSRRPSAAKKGVAKKPRRKKTAPKSTHGTTA